MNRKQRIHLLARKPRMYNKLMCVEQNVLSVYYLCMDFLQRCKLMVEVGCYSGGSTDVFSMFSKKILAVDCWADNSNPNQDGVKHLNAAEKIFKIKLKRWRNVELIRETSLEARKFIKEKSLDAIYIDGDHRIGAVAKDLILWYDKIKVGGVIAGHDYNDKNVRCLVNEIIGKPEKTYADTSWVCIKKNKVLK